MDIIGHAFAGVVLGQAAAPKSSDRQLHAFAILTATGASLLPDLDAVSYIWGPDAFAAIHQKYTHSVFALGILVLAGAYVAWRIYPRAGFRYTLVLLTCALGVHVAGDLIAHWPVEFFYPLSRKGWTFGLIRQDFSLVVDMILAAGALLSFYDPLKPHRRVVALSTFGVLVAYLLFGPGW